MKATKSQLQYRFTVNEKTEGVFGSLEAAEDYLYVAGSTCRHDGRVQIIEESKDGQHKTLCFNKVFG